MPADVTYPNASPFEIIGAPFTFWFAPVGTAKPNIHHLPESPWTKLGSSGTLNYSEDGSEVEHPQEFNFFRAAGDAASRKAFRTTEDLIMRVTLVDLTLEQYKVALNRNTVTTVPGTGEGYKRVSISRGLVVDTMAILLKGPGPYGHNMPMQYFVPIMVQIGSPTPVFRRGEPAMLNLEWRALVDTSQAAGDELGWIEAMNVEAT